MCTLKISVITTIFFSPDLDSYRTLMGYISLLHRPNPQSTLSLYRILYFLSKHLSVCVRTPFSKFHTLFASSYYTYFSPKCDQVSFFHKFHSPLLLLSIPLALLASRHSNNLGVSLFCSIRWYSLFFIYHCQKLFVPSLTSLPDTLITQTACFLNNFSLIFSIRPLLMISTNQFFSLLTSTQHTQILLQNYPL